MFSVDHRGWLYRGDIHHAQWPLQRAEAEFEVNAMTEPLGIQLSSGKPLLHFAKSLEVLVWAIERIESR